MSGSATRFDEEAPTSADPGANDVAGTRLGNYELLERLPAGGMAEVFVARRVDPPGEDVVALKRILPHLARNQRFVRMFLDEARLAAQLDHANIVSVVDIGRAGNDYFFTMEYLHGENLHRVLARAVKTGIGIPLEQAVFITVHLCMALHYAHEVTDEHGVPLHIVHRDVSPANVMLTYDGAVKILDFGVAKAATQTQITKTGVTKGKASYMSPEQCQGKPVDRRSDVFALGILLYEMTTLRPLFRADNDLLVMQEIVSRDAAPPSSVVPNYPRDLEAIVMRALARDPSRRYATARELERDLTRFARLNNLSSSTEDFSEFVRRLFGTKPHPWRKPKVLVTQGETVAYGRRTTQPIPAPHEPTTPLMGVPQQAVPDFGAAPTAPLPVAGGPITAPDHRAWVARRHGPAHDGRRWIAVAAAIAILSVGGAVAYVVAQSPRGDADGDGAAGEGTATPPGRPAVALDEQVPGAPAGASSDEDPEQAAVPAAVSRCPEGMAYLEGGTFIMGTDEAELGAAVPPHEVEVAPFCLDIHEVTEEAFRRCSDEGECQRAASKATAGIVDAQEWAVSDKLCNARKPGKEFHPVNCVKWQQADMYCRYRGGWLPTEAHWEFAAAGVQGRRFPWGVEAPMADRLNACGVECRNWRENLGLPVRRTLYEANDAKFGTASVGSFPAGRTPEGVEDLAGNVMEWTASAFAPYPGGTVPRAGVSANAKVARGGSFASTELAAVSAAARHAFDANGAYADVGFRCAADPR